MNDAAAGIFAWYIYGTYRCRIIAIGLFWLQYVLEKCVARVNAKEADLKGNLTYERTPDNDVRSALKTCK
jgi:hypothetical protein